MKISPLPQGQGGNPVQPLTQTSNADRLANAKAIAAGQEPTTNQDPQVARAQQSIRNIKMRTNATTSTAAPVAEESSSAISDDVGQITPTEDTKPLSPQFAALAKQRRALQVKEREIADREKALESRPTNDGTPDLVARLKSNPLSVLQEHGVTYDQLTEAILANQSGLNPEISELKAQIKALKEGVDKNFVDRDTHAEQQVLAEMQREAEQLVKEGEDYEMIRETKSLPDAMELIKRTYKTTGEVLEVTEALRLVEDDLVSESLKIANIKKIQSRITPTESTQPLQQRQPQMRTLTNRDSASIPMDRKARAIAAMNGTLKK